MHCQSGMQTGLEEDCIACTKCWVQSKTVCCCYHANPWPTYNSPDFQLGQDGLHWCKKVHAAFITLILYNCSVFFDFVSIHCNTVARHQQAHSSCFWCACQQSETARFRWPQFACGTICRPMSLCRHRCRHSRDSWRQNCLFGATHSSDRIWHSFFTAHAARTSFRFCLFCFVRCSNSLWHYATLISFVH